MSNARNLANLLGTGSTIATAKIADDAITSAKLADDSVVAAAIADDAVTSAAIGTDAVVADGLKSDAIALTDLPSGAIIQCKRGVTNNPGAMQTTSTSYVAMTSTPTVTITPKFASSVIVLFAGGAIAHFNRGTNAGPSYNIGHSINGGSYAMVDTTGPMDGIFKNAQTSGHWEDHIVHWSYSYSPSYTLGHSIAYKLYTRRTTAGSDAWPNHHGGIGSNGPGSSSLYITAMEVRS